MHSYIKTFLVTILIVAAVIYSEYCSAALIKWYPNQNVTWATAVLDVMPIGILMIPWALLCGLVRARFSFVLALFIAGILGDAIAWRFSSHEVSVSMLIAVGFIKIFTNALPFLVVYFITCVVAGKGLWKFKF